jgi:hypothetical protein
MVNIGANDPIDNALQHLSPIYQKSKPDLKVDTQRTSFSTILKGIISPTGTQQINLQLDETLVVTQSDLLTPSTPLLKHKFEDQDKK